MYPRLASLHLPSGKPVYFAEFPALGSWDNFALEPDTARRRLRHPEGKPRRLYMAIFGRLFETRDEWVCLEKHGMSVYLLTPFLTINSHGIDIYTVVEQTYHV